MIRAFMAFIAFRKMIDYGILRPTENALDSSLARREISDLKSQRINCRARLPHSTPFVVNVTKGDQVMNGLVPACFIALSLLHYVL